MFGVSTPHGEGVAQTVFFGLFALQHRGQEAAGIAVSDGSRVRMHKESGLVANVFTPATMAPLSRLPRHRPHPLQHHRRRTPSATSSRSWSRRCTARSPLAHNGNLVNAPALRDELLSRGFGLTATSDTEVMTLMLAAAGGRTWEDRIERTLPAWKGAYSLVHAGRRPGDRGARPVGLPAAARRPPAPRRLRRRLARRAPSTRSAASTSARSRPARSSRCSGAEMHRRQALTPAARPARCTFEFVYFSRPDSVWAGRNMHHVRQRLGEELAARVAAPTPTSSSPCPTRRSPPPSATAGPAASRYNDGLIKNRYIGRTFIEPTQDLRERGVALKFNALRREPRRASGS